MDLICLRAEKPACNILLICEFTLKSPSMKTPRHLTLSEGDMKVPSILICLVGNLFTFLKEENHIASIIAGDFNAQSQSWHSPFTDHIDQLITSLLLNSNHIILNQNTFSQLPFNPNQQPPLPDITTADTSISANLT